VYTSEERIADGILHVIGICAGTVAVVAMMVAAFLSLPATTTTSLAIYGVGLLAMFSCSAAYNLISSPKWSSTLQRLDHAAIFLKIAGTYTPFGILMGGIAGHILLGVVWTVALLGAAVKLLKSNCKGIDVPIYLVLGWVGLLAFRPLSDAVSPLVLALLGIGGVLYSVGVIFHVWRSLKYQNAIWHGFVLVATGVHFSAVTTAMFA
jgi:hemolysin III